jgi:hypothetical protein
MNRTVSFDIPESRVAEVLCSACEGGSNYWAGFTCLPYRWPNGFTADAELVLPVTIRNREEGGTVTLDSAAIDRGIAASLKHPRALAALSGADHDAHDADLFLQLCLFGELVYG